MTRARARTRVLWRPFMDYSAHHFHRISGTRAKRAEAVDFNLSRGRNYEAGGDACRTTKSRYATAHRSCDGHLSDHWPCKPDASQTVAGFIRPARTSLANVNRAAATCGLRSSHARTAS
jgi:hypothetical protein